MAILNMGKGREMFNKPLISGLEQEAFPLNVMIDGEDADGSPAKEIESGLPRTKGQREKSKAILSRALQEANTAVLLERADNFGGAIEAYRNACQLLQQICDRSETDREEIEAIRVSYTSRVKELTRLNPSLQFLDEGSGAFKLFKRPTNDDDRQEMERHHSVTPEAYSAHPPVRSSTQQSPSVHHGTSDVSTPPDSSEKSLEFDVDEVEIQKGLLLDRLMLRVYRMFDTRGAYRQHQQDASENLKSSSSKPSSENTTWRGTMKHGRSVNEGDDGDNDESDDHIGKKPRQPRISGEDSKRERKKSFACPFFKHDPGRYCTARHCAGPTGWETIPRLKEHLYRRHTLGPQCIRCCQIFDDDAKLIDHQRSPESCVVRTQNILEGLNKKQIERLKHRRSMFQAGSEEEKWKIIFLICFPDTALDAMPTPYYEDEILEREASKQSPKDPTLAQYEAYMNRELPRKVRQELEIAIERLIGPLEETLKNQLEGLIRDCQEKLSKEYECSNASPSARLVDKSSETASSSSINESSNAHDTFTSSALDPYLVPMFSESAYFSNKNFSPPENSWDLQTWDGSLNNATSGLAEAFGEHALGPCWSSAENETEANKFYHGKGKGKAPKSAYGTQGF